MVEHSTIALPEEHGTTDGTEGRFDQDVWQVYTAAADEVSIVSWPAPLDPDPQAWEPLEVETFGNEELDTGAEDQLAAHEVGLTDAVAAAVTARPGPVVIVATTDDVSARPFLAVGILQDDGTALRVTVDAATGEVLNAVPVGDGASDGRSRDDRDESEEPDEGGTTT
ncbi:PepSY domain-containing protein [Georgenia sp. Z1344]|uniref:PepSY domain-containing protein n=1 Tax=Georgenia sp. Z1344 TaxID=3416706 RepID=UPI003CEAB47C